MSNTPETQVSKSIAVGATEKGSVEPSDASKHDGKTEYKVAEVREDGTVMVEMADGRMFPAALADGVEVKKRNTVNLKADGFDKDGVPTNPVITKVL